MTVLDLRPEQVRILDLIDGQTVEEIEKANGGYLIFRAVDGSTICAAGPRDTVSVNRPEPEPEAPRPACFADPEQFGAPGKWATVSYVERGDFTTPLYLAPVPEDLLVQAGYAFELRAVSGKWYPQLSVECPEAGVHVRNVRPVYERKV